MEPIVALSLFKSILETSSIIEEDNNITDQNEGDPYESSMMLKWVDESRIAQILNTIKMKQLTRKPMYLAPKPKCQLK